MRCVVVIGHVFVRWMVTRLMDVLPVRLVVLRRTRVVPWFRMVRRMIIRVRGRMAVIVVRGVSLVMVGATVMVVVMPVLRIRRSAGC